MQETLKPLKLEHGIGYIKPLYINGERVHAMCLWEAFCDIEVTHVENKPIVDNIRSGDFKSLKILAGSILKNGDKLIHPEYIDYYFGWRFNGDD